MPVYQYACTECGEQLEVRQSFTDDALTVCPVGEGRLRKVLSAVGVVFKGSGFYNTDYGTAKRKRETDRSASEGADKHDAKQKDKKDKKDSKPDSSSSSSSSSSSTKQD